MRPVFPLAASLLLATGASAQTVLLREGDPSPDGAIGQVVSRPTFPAVNQSGGFGCSVSTQGLAGNGRLIWGALSTGPGGLLRAPTTIGAATQTGFGDGFGLGASDVIYEASIDLSTGQTSVDSVWRGDTAVTVAGQPVTGVPGRVFRAMVDIGATESGQPHFYAILTDAPGGPLLERGIFLNNLPVLMSGQSLPNVVQRVASVDIDYAMAPSGLHHLLGANLENFPSSEDGIIVLDGAGLELGGSLVRDSVTIPVSAGGTGDAWDSFDLYAINSDGDFAFSGRTDASSNRGFIAREGGIWIRQGDQIEGLTLRDRPLDIYVSPTGVLFHCWETEDEFFNQGSVMFVEDRVLIRDGDQVDWDGDGALDPWATLQGFSSSDIMAVNANGTVFFTGSVNVNGTSLDALIQVESGGLISTNYCQANANASGLPATISALGSSIVSDGDLTLVCSDMPQGAFGFFIVGQTQGFIPNPAGSAGNLCLTGSIGRFQQQIQNSGTAGTFQIPVDLTAIPRPTGSVAVMAGDTWNFSTWFRDTDGMGGLTSNFSDGLEVTFL